MKTGVLGGTFDPPHVGHLIVAQDAALALGLDRILFIPAAVPPHKRDNAITPPGQRRRMLELAIEGDTRFGVDPVELERTGPSYTVDTLRELTVREPDTRFTLLIGADQYAEFGTWREPAAILDLVELGVLTRAGETGAGAAPDDGDATRPAVWPIADRVSGIAATRIDISSTAIRGRVAAGLPIRYMVPPPVERFIFEHGLYVRNGTAVAG